MQEQAPGEQDGDGGKQVCRVNPVEELSHFDGATAAPLHRGRGADAQGENFREGTM